MIIKTNCCSPKRWGRAIGICVLASLAGCAGSTHPKQETQIASQLRTQSWTLAQSQFWSSASAGSRLLPYSWYLALEQAGSTEQFAKIDHIQSFGYLKQDWTSNHGLPVGFAVDQQDESGFGRSKLKWYRSQQHTPSNAEPWVGLNCAACHTKDITYEGERIRIYGGDGQGDLQAMVAGLLAAMRETLNSEQKWQRFSTNVLGSRNNAGNRALLRSAAKTWIADIGAINSRDVKVLNYGPGRTDAFGQIFNTLQRMINRSGASIAAEDAAVNYPVLWNIHRQKHLQWNGYAVNDNLRTRADNPIDTRALGRNIGAILGSYGDISLVKRRSKLRDISVDSSIQFQNLVSFENLIRRLDAPQWPNTFPAISSTKALRGEQLYTQHCAQCHLRYDEVGQGQTSDIRVTFRDTPERHQTDVWTACNIFTREGPAGVLEGKREFLFAGARYEEKAPMHSVVSTLVWAAAAQHLRQLIPSLPKLLGTKESTRQSTLRTARPNNIPKTRDERRKLCVEAEHPLLAYKARPLDGIWSSAPYLHNGSVPTLYDLLLPASKRPDRFWLGNREFDVERVGISQKPVPNSPTRGFLFRVRGPNGQTIPGNSNAGHEYGVDHLDHDDRIALIEYLKGL